jgi:hypothetical protein
MKRDDERHRLAHALERTREWLDETRAPDKTLQASVVADVQAVAGRA